ncbi:MAG: hypothetical protein ACT4QC_16510 [Planctomycetaceae bacterium]
MSVSTPQSESLAPAAAVRRWLYVLVIAVAAAQGLAHILTTTVQYSPARWPENRPPHTPILSANDRSRWCTVWSLVERGTYQIDEIIQQPGWDTIDKVRYGDHFYSSKPPLLPTLVAGLYWGLKRATNLDLLTNTHETVHILLILVNWIPWIAALALLAVLGERHAKSDFTRIFLIVAAAWGTLLATFLVTFNNHTPAANCLVFSLAPALSILIDCRRSWWRYSAAGFWAACTVCNELPAALYGVLLCAWLARYDLKRTCCAFLPAALVPVAAFFVTNWLVTGGVMPFYASFGSASHDYYRYVHEGIPSYWMNPSAVDIGEQSAWVYFWHCTFGHHGIWSLSPVFLLTLAGWLSLARPGASPLRGVAWLALGLTVWILAFYLAQTKNYNYGGVTSGLRWAFWLIPLWLLSMVPFLDAWAGWRMVRGMATLCLAISAFSATFPERNPWQQPWLYNLWQQANPPPAKAETEPTPARSLWLKLPLEFPAQSEDYWVELAGTRGDGGPARLRLAWEKPATADEVRLRVERTGDFEAGSESLSLVLDLAAWREGGKASDVLQQPGPDLTLKRQEALRFLNGLPKPVSWSATTVRYLKTPLRSDAFKCRVAVAAVAYRSSAENRPLRYRRAVWWCDEVPFGVMQIEESVTDPRDNAIVHKQRWMADRVGQLLPTPAAEPTESTANSRLKTSVPSESEPE